MRVMGSFGMATALGLLNALDEIRCAGTRVICALYISRLTGATV